MASDLIVRTDDGVDLAVDVHPGSAADCLLLIPGLGSSRAIYADLIPFLTPFRTVVVYDPRGIGDSAMAPPPWPLGRLGNDAAAVIAATAGLNGRCDVFGASMGGIVAQHLAFGHPSLVRSLVLAATTPGGNRAVARNSFARDRLLGKGARTPEAAYRLACTVLYSRRFLSENPEFVEGQVAYRAAHPIRAQAFAAQTAASFSHDGAGMLATLNIPVLVMHGTDDAVMPWANAQLLASLVPGSQHRWFDGLGHLFFHEDPVTTARVIGQFLAAAAF